MKLAIATEGNRVSGHFGRCENFMLCEIEEGKVIEKKLINTQGNQHAALPVYLNELGVNEVISGGAGNGAIESLARKDIKIITGVQGNIEDVIQAYLKGELKSSGAVCSEHNHERGHHHEHGHNGHEHSCNCGGR